MRKPRIALALAGVLCLGALTALSPTASADPGDDIPPKKKSSVLAPTLQAVSATPDARTQQGDDQTSPPPDGPGSLLKYGSTGYLVDIRVTEVTDTVVANLATAGATITYRDTERRILTAGVQPEDLADVSAVDGVEYVDDILTPLTNCGSVTSAGDTILTAAALRSAQHVDGTGVSVGVLSDSYNLWGGAPTHAPGDVLSGDLPGTTSPCGSKANVDVLDDNPTDHADARDEGRAMAQIVHDVAPGADVKFATARSGEGQFAANIQALAAGGADVIVDDVTYLDEPFYQDGVVAKAVNSVAAGGVQYFSSAGNSNVKIGSNDVGSYEAGFRDAGASPCGDIHDFDSGPGTDSDFGFTLKPGRTVTVDLQWAEPFGAPSTDLDMYLLDSANSVVAFSNDFNVGPGSTLEPLEVFTHTNLSPTDSQDLRLFVCRFSGTQSPRFKFIFFGDSDMFASMERPTVTAPDVMGPTIFGHNGAEKAISVAASSVQVSPSTVNAFSAHGPVTLLLGPVGATPAEPLAAPLVLAKPDLTASDCGLTTFFAGSVPPYHFCGTSAAAPHAAAVAALLRQLRPGASAAEITGAMKSTALSLGAPALTQGSGLVQAAAAGVALVGTPVQTMSTPSNCNGQPTTQVGTPGDDILVGTPGPDVIDGLGGNDRINGLGGDDIICNTGGGSLVADGGRGRDLIIGTSGTDILLGRAGGDFLVGHGGNDDLRGGNGHDAISGGDGNDVMRGGKGDDLIDGGPGADAARGGPGRDSIRSATGR
jgi:hypothetical protein